MITETPVLDRWIDLLERALQIAQAREVGLISWHLAVANTMDEIRTFLAAEPEKEQL